MVGSPRAPLLLLAALIVSLALALSPAAAQGPRKGRLLGGLMEADVNEEGVQEALSFAVSEFNKRSNDAYQSRAMRVVRARKQVRPAGQGAEIRGPRSGLRVGARGLPKPGPRRARPARSPQPRPRAPRARSGGQPPTPRGPGNRQGCKCASHPGVAPGLSRRLQPFAGLASLLGKLWGHWVLRLIVSCQLNDHRRRKLTPDCPLSDS